MGNISYVYMYVCSQTCTWVKVCIFVCKYVCYVICPSCHKDVVALHYFINCLIKSRMSCKLIVLHTALTYIHSWHAYGGGLFLLSHMTLLVIITLYICTCLTLYINWENIKLISLHPPPFMLLARPLMVSMANMNDVFRHLIFWCKYVCYVICPWCN